MKVKRQPTEWEKVFANHVSGKRLVYRIYFLKNSYNSLIKNFKMDKRYE